MTNFLNRMAARALGAAPVAQPLLPPRFSRNAGAVKGDAFSGMPAESSTVEADGNDMRGSASRERPRNLILPEQARVDANRETASREFTSPELVDSNVLPEQRSADAGPDRRVFARATLPNSELDSPPLPIRPAHRTAPPSLHAAVESSAETLIDADHSSLAAARLTASETTFGPSPRVSASSAHTTLRSSVAATAGASHSRRRDAVESTTQAPVIRVSIGRIDVRAQFPAAPPPTPARNARPAAISLEEYLKQRREGKR